MKKKVNRRKFISTLGAGIAGTQLLSVSSCKTSPERTFSASSGTAVKFHADEKFYSAKAFPWRKIHLDFHNSKYMPSIGSKFNVDVWGDALQKGDVNSINIFAKDMHGYFYYPSKYGPVHPGLKFDLMGEQIKACKKRNIEVFTYYCTTWDHYLASNHPEWLVIKKDGSNYMPRPDQTPGWTALCLAHDDFLDLMVKHVKEWVAAYDIDGLFFDMSEPISPECYCKECMRQIKESGKDPNDPEVQRMHKNELFIRFHELMDKTVHDLKPDLHIVYNDIGIGFVSQRSHLLGSVELEALPTSSGWGYFYAPSQIRYQRNFGFPVYGVTGRFLSSWADFGGLKHPVQLEVETASLVANCAGCCVGDQMSPEGILYPAVYHVIGKAYNKIKEVEPWLENAAPVTEAALIIPAIPMDRKTSYSDYMLGMTKLMIESRLQFDVTEPGQNWEVYNMVVLPDFYQPDDKTTGRLNDYIKNGGSVIVVNQSGLNVTSGKSWLEQYGITYEGESPFRPAYMIPDVQLADDIPVYEYALYEGASQWKVEAPAVSMAKLGEPLFQRSPEHYTSHMQSPFDHLTDYSLLAVTGKLAFIGFPIGLSYFKTGYWAYRSAFEILVKEIFPVQMIETDAPLSTELTITHQIADKGKKRPERYMVHVINWSPARRAPHHPEFHEDPIPLTDVKIKLNLPLNGSKVTSVVNKDNIASVNGNEIVVKRIQVHEIICFELG